jgi:hypothetical protein
MDNSKKELNVNELEKVNGCGPITGFKGYMLPDRKKKTDETERKNQ